MASTESRNRYYGPSNAARRRGKTKRGTLGQRIAARDYVETNGRPRVLDDMVG